MKYRKKPVVIEAEHFVKPHIDNCLDFVGNDILKYDPVSNEYHVHTLEGAMLVRDRDYIIKGVKGEFYTCREDIFEETYEPMFVYDVNHDAEWLASVCRRMITSSEIARHNGYDKGWNRALNSIIEIIERSMIPPEQEGEE